MGQHSRQSHLGMFLREPYDDDTPLLFLSPDEGGVEWSWMDGPLGTKTLSSLPPLFSSLLAISGGWIGQLYEPRYAFILRDRRRRRRHRPSA